MPLSPATDSPASQIFALSGTRYKNQMSVRFMSREAETPQARPADLAGGAAPLARSPGGSKLGRKPEAFPPRGRSP